MNQICDMNSNEAYLVKLIREQNFSACEYLRQQCSAPVLGVLSGLIKSTETANNLLQDVLCRICSNIGSFRPGKTGLYTWMLKEARKVGMDYLRSGNTLKPVA
jgi:RNA polymerase sigma-70 factor (ECF subfamily)